MKFTHPRHWHDNWPIYYFLMAATFLCGNVNAYVFVVFREGVTHQTGNMTKFSVALFEQFSHGLFLGGIILAYFLGAVISGLIAGRKPIGYTKEPRWIFLCIGLFTCGINFIKNEGICFPLAFFSGITNSLLKNQYGSLIKVTHITGHLTDAGYALGELLRGHQEFKAPLFLSVSFFVAFFLGGVIAYVLTLCFSHALFVIGLGWVALSATYYYLFRDFFQR
ncbi:MAG: DUF1275 domain-containing protein [Lentisphaerae bacterium]|nr:DUF1275 domain-containing protein [Lentisphaerota bacterium]